MPANAVTVTANFVPTPHGTYNIIVMHTGNGNANANVNYAAPGELITLTAEPDSGNRFVHWEVLTAASLYQARQQ